ncbi:MAG: sigma factor-like helix-turn-helix DNA-binding protein [Nitrospirota bacterium]
MKTCRDCPEFKNCIEICLSVKKSIPAVEAGRNSDREVLMSPADLALTADLHSLSEWNVSRTKTAAPSLDLAVLSPSERRALMLIADGLSYADASAALGVSRSTVQSYIRRARSKFAVQIRHMVKAK